MNRKSVDKALAEARRFLAIAKTAREEFPEFEFYSPTKQGGNLKRASMDLTRALAEMRRPN
jgi:hypothetical protein